MAEAKKATAPTMASNGVKTDTPTPAPQAKEVPPKNGFLVQQPEKSLNLTLKRIRELNQIADKRTKLIEVQDNLNGFKLSTDKMTDKLKLSDGFGNIFETSNTAVIADVLALLKSSLQSVIDETEAMLTL